MARTTRSAKDLWSLVTGFSVLNYKELVQYEIEKNSDHIVNGVLYFRKSNQASLDTLKKTVDESHFEFINKLSKLIDVDALQCYDLFLSYSAYEFKGTQKTLEAQLINERQAHVLLLEMWHYYFGERLYYLLTLKHILSHWQDDSDAYKEIYEAFFEKYNKDNAVVSKVIKQMETSINTELPTKETHGAYMSDLLAYHWVTFILKEQCELLQILLLYYKVIEPAVEDVEKMFTLFQSHGFGLRQSFRMVLADDTQNLVASIGYLESFVLIQCFEIDFLFKCKESGMISEYYLLKNEKALKNLTTSILNLGSHQSHSPILMAWLLVIQSSSVPDIAKHCNKLGKTALQLNVFEYLASALTTSVFSGTGIIPDIANSIVYNLLAAVLSLFDLQYLGPIKPLFDIAKEALQYSLVSNDFWKKGEETGIGELFTYCVEMFPVEFCPVLDLCASLALANKDSCTKVTDYLRTLPIFTEYLENIDERDIIATPEPNIWQLITDRTLYGDNTLIIPKGTYGIVTKDKGKEGCSIIQWKVTLNGWQICLREIFQKLQEMSFSSVLTSQDSIMKIVSVAKLVLNILRTDINTRFNFTHIINVLFSILQRCISSPSPPLKLVSICLNIAAALSKDEISDVWQQLSHIRLLPYLTHTPKNTLDLIGGMCMNVGILGQLIASKECPSGEYSVCQSFLKLVSNVSLTIVKEDDTFIACVTYILREVFSYFHKWYFADPQQRILLGQQCLNLLHNLFSLDKQRSKILEKTQDLCIFSLLHLEAGQTLLKIVCTGEEIIQQTILKQNSLLGDQIASMIRLSLSVLNRLLLLRNDASVTFKTESSPLVSVLFSTPGRTDQPQVVLMVAHYAFQRYNPRLATLAVQLLKRFAKEFPMSLLGCFGSEAEAIRDHFLARLSSRCEDIRLKFSILEFLTVCVAQQPGLIEMFINVKKKDDKNSKSDETKSCLDCVKNILKEKMNESKEKYPRDLLCAAVEFIHALWAGHQALAMEALKEDSQFWNLTCCTILNDELLQNAPGINAYIIRTIALEVFYGGRNRLHLPINDIFKNIEENILLLKWSKHIHCQNKKEDMDVETQLESSFIDFQDSFALLTSWRDFLLIITVYEPIKLSSEVKKQILKNILEHFSEELNENNSRVLILLSELFLMLSKYWQGEFIAFIEEEGDQNPIYRVLSEVSYNADTIHLREQLVIISLAVYTVRTFSKSDLKIKNLKEWIIPCCQMLKKTSHLIHQSIDPKYVEGVQKLPIVITILLNELVQEVKDCLPILKNQGILPLLVSLLIKSLKLNVGLELAHAIIVLFLSMSSDKKASETLCNTGFMAELTLILANVNLEKHATERKSMVTQKSKICKIDIYFAFLRFVTALLQTLGNYFLQDCWNFIGVHQELMHLSLIRTKTSFRLEDIQEAIFTSNFILQLSSHQQAWKLEHPKSLQTLLVDVCNCINGTVAILSKPELLKYSVMKKNPDAKLKPLQDNGTGSLVKRGNSEDDGQPSAEVLEIQEKLYELLSITLAILTKYSPEIYETLSGHTFDYAQWQLLLHINFSAPSLDRDVPLGFGSLLACVNMCLKQLVKNEKTPSPRKAADSMLQINRYLTMYILEISLAILMSQSNIAMTHPGMHLRDKQLIKRELAPELNSMNITMNRFLRRGPSSPVSVTAFTTPSPMKPQSSDYPFLRLISNLIEKLFK